MAMEKDADKVHYVYVLFDQEEINTPGYSQERERLRGGNYSIQKINRLVDSAFDKLLASVVDHDAKREDIIWTAWWLG
jgi:hypothetical protein